VDPNASESRGSGRHGKPCLKPFPLPIYDEASHQRFVETGKRPEARCRTKCANCVRIGEREWITSFAEEHGVSRGWVGYMVLNISTEDLTPEETYWLLKRCYDLFMKRLRAKYKGRAWKSLATRWEGGDTGRFPHINVVLFGWRYVPKKILHAIWGDVTLEVTGKRATADHIGAVGPKDLGRIGWYTFKEQLTGLSKYTWKEGRPSWMPHRRRMWTKTPGSLVRAWPKQRGSTSRSGSATRGQPEVEAARDQLMRSVLGLTTDATVSSLAEMRGPPQLFD